MFETVNKTELLTKLETCETIIVCDDHYLTNEIREAFPNLYIKPMFLVKEGQFPNALYVVTSEQNIRENVQTYLVKEEADSIEVDADTADFLDSINFDSTQIEPTEPEETEFPAEELIEEIEDTEEEPQKPYEDMEFNSMSELVSALTPDMQIVAKADMISALREKRPDVSINPIEKGGISLTGGMVVLLRIRSKICRKEARKIYPPTATLYTIYC